MNNVHVNDVHGDGKKFEKSEDARLTTHDYDAYMETGRDAVRTHGQK
jgi:hypothetical protein